MCGDGRGAGAGVVAAHLVRAVAASARCTIAVLERQGWNLTCTKGRDATRELLSWRGRKGDNVRRKEHSLSLLTWPGPPCGQGRPGQEGGGLGKGELE